MAESAERELQRLRDEWIVMERNHAQQDETSRLQREQLAHEHEQRATAAAMEELIRRDRALQERNRRNAAAHELARAAIAPRPAVAQHIRQRAQHHIREAQQAVRAQAEREAQEAVRAQAERELAATLARRPPHMNADYSHKRESDLLPAPAPEPAPEEPGRQCRICYQDMKCKIWALVPCGHFMLCESCATKVLEIGKCPYDRKTIQGLIRLI